MIIFAYLPYGLAEGISLSGKRTRVWKYWGDGALSHLLREVVSLGYFQSQETVTTQKSLSSKGNLLAVQGCIWIYFSLLTVLQQRSQRHLHCCLFPRTRPLKGLLSKGGVGLPRAVSPLPGPWAPAPMELHSITYVIECHIREIMQHVVFCVSLLLVINVLERHLCFCVDQWFTHSYCATFYPFAI